MWNLTRVIGRIDILLSNLLLYNPTIPRIATIFIINSFGGLLLGVEGYE